MSISTATIVKMIDTRSISGAITLPLTTQIPYRVITLKDIYGTAAVSSIIVTTQGTDVFENGLSSITLADAFETTTLYAGQPGYWYVIGGSRLAAAAIGTLSTGLIANPLRLGTLSTQTSIQFPGLRSNYTGTVITGQTTGIGTQELLLYQTSTTSDQIRLQTTGNIVFEAGASARSWPSTAALATPTLYIAGSTSNVGIGTAAPATTLDVAGTGRFQTLSTQSFNVSSINGVAPVAAFNGSTMGLSAATIFVSSLVTTSLTASTALITYNGTTAGGSYGQGIDTLTLQSSSNAYVGGVASMAFATAKTGYPLARIYALDSATSGNAISQLVFQTVPQSTSTVFSNAFYAVGSNQTFTVPANVSQITVTMWGAGGGPGDNSSTGKSGGAGAYITGTLAVTPGQTLNIIVGSPGTFFYGINPGPYGGGGLNSYAGSGGGRSAIQVQLTVTITSGAVSGGNIVFNTNSAHGLAVNQPVIISSLNTGFTGIFQVTVVNSPTQFTVVNLYSATGSSVGTGTIAAEVVDVGGGGGGGISGQSSGVSGGNATYTGTAVAGSNGTTATGGGGGSQTAGGAAGTGTNQSRAPTAGSLLQGGQSTDNGGSGGGGYFGGGGGNTGSANGSGGGGGSSYTSNPLFTLITGSNSSTGQTAPATTVTGYVSNAAAGGTNTVPTGGPGLVLFSYQVVTGITLSEAMRINSNAYVGIGTTAPVTLLDVAGTARAQTVSTLALTVSSINGQTFGQPIQSTVIGLGTAGYISTLTNVPYISAQTIQTSTLNTTYFSSVQGYVSSLRTDSLTVGGPQGYVTIQDLTTGTVSTGQIVVGAGFISSLQINTLSFGPSGYVIVTNFIANTLSTTKLNAQNIYANNLYVGNTSTQSAILFPGIDGTYKGTAIAEQTTGVGTEELLLYKVSTATDQIRLQTTGNIVFEAGAASRSWPSTATLATPTLYIQGSTSNVGVGTAAPAATLDVAGTGRFQIISSLTLNVSSINGAAPGAGGSGTTFNGSTLSLSAATIFVSSLVTTSLTASTALIVLNGSTAPTSFGQGVDTLTLQASNSYVGAVASMAFATATVSYPLARIYALDSASSGPALSQLVFQTVPTNASSFSSTFSYTGANQTFTVPAGVTTISVTLWGAGGSGSGVGGIGGAGAFIQGTLSVTPGQTLILVVGQGGVYNSGGSTYGGGGGNLGYGNAGGGRSAIQTTIAATITTATGSGTSVTYTTNSAHGLYANQPVVISNLSPSGYNGTFIVASILSSTQFTVVNTTTGASSGTGTIVAELVDVGGGGGAGASNNAANGGAASYSGTASTGVSTPYNTGGGGGSQTAGGAAATSTTYGTPTAGTVLAGGAGSQYGSGGGGGYYGGGGSSAPTSGWCSGAGGGSSFTSYSGFTLLAGSNSTNGTSAPATGYNGYQAGVAAGGATSTNGGSGLILLASIGNALAEAMRIATTGYVGIGTAAPATLLDVAGTARATTISSLALQTSSINGAAPWQPSFLTSTVQSLGTAGYLSSTQILNTSKIVGLSSLLSYSYVTYNVTTPIASTSVPGIAVDKTSTYLYYGNGGYIYKYTLATGTAAAFVGNGTNTFQDGTGTSAGLTSYGGALCIDPTNTIMYAFDGTRIRKIILSSGVVTTIAGNGTSTGTAGTVDGTGTGATITYNRNTALNASGTILYWMDYASNGVYLRQCVLSTGVVTTLAGRTGTTSINGYGLSACFGNGAQGLAIDSAGNIYISDLAIPGIRVYTPSDGYVSGGISGISQAGLSLCVDSFNQLWIPPWTPSMSGQIVVYNLTTRTSFIVGSGYGPANGSQTVAQFGAITPIVADTLGNIYIGEFSYAGGYQDAVRFIKATTNYSTIQVQGTFNVGTLIASAATVGAISTLSISTGAIAVSSINGAAPWQPSFLTSTVQSLASNISSMIDPTELTSTITGLGTIGFVSTVGLTYAVASTAQGLGTFGYASTNQLLSTTIGVYGAIGSNITTTVQPQFISTVQGLGTAGYISSSTSFNGSTTTLSAAVINVSSLSSAFVKATQGYISSLTVDYLAIGSNVGFMNMGDIITTSHSSLQINTGIFTASGTVCTPQIIVSTINGLAYTAAIPFTGSTLSLSTASVFASSLQASTISVGGGAWMSNDGLYLSNVQAGGAVGKLITNAGYVKLVTATAWNGGYGAFAITGGDLTPKIYMNAGQVATGAQMAIGGFNPSPGAGISLDVFGTARFSTISTIQAITSSMGVGTATPQALLDVAGTGRFQILSTLNLQVSTINGALPGTGSGGTTFVGSTTFLSAAQATVSSLTLNALSSVTGFVSTMYAGLFSSPYAYISSLQVDELQVGTGYGIVAFGDTNMSSLSTLGIAAGLGNFTTINVSSINGAIPGTGSGTTFTGNLGTVSSLTALRFYGLTGTYANTAVAEVSTGTGNQELLLYKVSSIADQVRVQTTGNVIFETGVGARGWPTASRATVPTFYIAGSNSNVGVGTSNPLTTLDVAGTGRFQTLSSLNITAGSINYSVAFV